VRGRLADGSWATPFDPTSTKNFTEANAWQYTWAAQHDVPGLITLLGGAEPFVQKLDGLFAARSAISGPAHEDISGMIGQYVHGNEPSHHTAYLYAYAGRPDRTQERVRQILATMYDDTPAGLCGNDDCGQMSAWYVLSALGFYPVSPISGEYVLGSPLFRKATLNLGGGHRLVIEAPETSPTRLYVRGATLDGRPLAGPRFSHASIARGGRLVFDMTDQPQPRWPQP
jgi:predicted alpha-1,2-mannosidase